MISTPEQAEEFVRWAKFAPRGRRGLNNWGHDGKFSLTPVAEFCRQANEKTFVAIQIETVSAVECCEEIASIEGVDHLFIGPADLSQAYGVTGQMSHPLLLAAIARVSRACAAYNKTFGAVSFAPEQAASFLEQGCRLISITSDVHTFQHGITAVKDKFHELFADQQMC
ncbi:2-dehydro-3-deoxyglucarate aldolase/4-hydroxy-2-oxoheptanedioate aldolase [Planctomicrobium piriforme]|uniref:2-dehydro-3-deoxyglucarate aldolase/4-hydroxy-2-oxoheptanedioate aldolase n=2 Tax=Planctomicrobium piriforme TaxID=1576369 RepID=A0A1I3MZ52_9PLAN|nr:2-dehydro-3-deoxyglucarate aldolase/4-hydroxy-2-oxoheptanedioate aldolase [Planctomicrobium piriforme]